MVKTKINKHKYKHKNKHKNKHKTLKKFKKLNCSPLSNNNNKDSKLNKLSCYDNNNLELFKKVWNENTNKKIFTNNSEEIWNFFKKELSNKCYNELCWLESKPLNKVNNKELIIKELFKPFSPESWKSKPSTWLSSIDISKIMYQYEKVYKNFAFIGPSPIDFDSKQLFSTCVWEKLCKFDLKEYINKKKYKIGIIFNLDPHNKPGSHWVALFININKKFIFYFDSNGIKIPKQINNLVSKIKKQGHELNLDFLFDSNEDFVHQYGDGQCGMFSLYFIIELLKESKTYNYFKKYRISDTTMKKYRKKYYNELQK